MGSRLDGIPVYEQSPTSLEAADYNQAELALKRLGEPLRIHLAGLRSLELIVDHEAWIVVDRDLNEVPVIAWTNFQVEGRSSLHEPIPCVLKSYHVHGSQILEQVAIRLREALAQYLDAQRRVTGERVVPLKKG